MKNKKQNKDPWENYPHIWPTQASFMSYIRGGIRRGLWEKHPVKLEFIKKNRIRVPLGKKTNRNPEGLVWGCRCALCGKIFRESDCQVDHIKGNHSLKTVEDILEFIKSLIFIREEDLQIVDKECHKIKSYAERNNISFKEAGFEKEAIKFSKKKVEEQKEILLALGATKEDTKNAKIRRECYRRLLGEKERK